LNKSVYKYAAEAGLPAGLYLTVMSACVLLSLRVEFLPTLILPLLIGFPFLLGYGMRRMARTEPSYMKFSALWLFGIYTVIFGTLICSFFSGVYLLFVDPGFVHAYVERAIADVEASPVSSQYEATTAIMRDALDSHILPNGMQFVATMGWFTCFFGSVLSMVLAMVVSRGKPRKTAGIWR
jgi:hypothetical protein